MSGLSSIVRKHVDATLEEAGQQGFAADDVARTMLSFAIEIWRGSRSPEDIAGELRYVLDNLDPDEEYTFMRP